MFMADDATFTDVYKRQSDTYRTDPEEIGNVWKNRSQKEDLKAFLLPFG